MWFNDQQYTEKSWLSKQVPKQYGMQILCAQSARHGSEYQVWWFWRWLWFVRTKILSVRKAINVTKTRLRAFGLFEVQRSDYFMKEVARIVKGPLSAWKRLFSLFKYHSENAHLLVFLKNPICLQMFSNLSRWFWKLHHSRYHEFFFLFTDTTLWWLQMIKKINLASTVVRNLGLKFSWLATSLY